MEIISSLIPLFVIISIVFSIINKAKQAQKKTTNTKPRSASGVSSKSNLSLQEIIRQQIEEQRSAAVGSQSPTQASVPQPEPQKTADNSSFAVNRTYKEGDALNRSTLEGTPVEMQRHSHNAHLRESYNEGDALNRKSLEGSPILDYVDKFDLDKEIRVTRKKKNNQKAKKQSHSKVGLKSFDINRQSVVNGIVMSEILGKRGGRRAAR